MKSFLFLSALVLCNGCATVQEYKETKQLLMNPQRINESTDKKNIAYHAQQVQVHAYYSAMKQAETDYSKNPAKIAQPQAILNYVNEGIALNTAYCRRWFHRIDDTSRQFEIGSRDFNIITSLGTTALGLFNAGATAVAAYGAAITAVNGFGDNFNTSLLTAPSSKNVESKIMSLVGEYAVRLKAEAAMLLFPEAYTRLEAMADICTFTSIRDIVNNSLRNSEVSVTPTGAISTIKQ